jgi:histidine decarboxylase
MLNRRGFLASSGIAAASVALCRPVRAESAAVLPPLATSPDEAQEQFLRSQAQRIRNKDPKIFLGYPANMNRAPEGLLKWRRELAKVEIGERTANNVGDPFEPSGIANSHLLERDLVARFGTRYGFPTDDTWGFVSHSGTDSNMHGAYIGRTLLQQRTGVEPKIYYTAEAHYSIQIIRDLLGLEEVLVKTNEDASMNVEDLADKLARDKNHPVLLIATFGTTFKGGIDDVDKIQATLKGRESFVHLDAALFGGYLQASPYASVLEQVRDGRRRYDSIAVSWHKFFGHPGVAGLFICRNKDFQQYREYFSQVHDPAYISHVPGTITCSRDSLSPAEVHYYSTLEAFSQQQGDAMLVLDNAVYLHEQMQRNFPQLQPRLANKLSNTVYFDKKFSDQVVDKWTLATVGGHGGNKAAQAHVVVMPHASKPLLDQFLNDLDADIKAG